MISCPQLHWGISDYLTATLDGNQEAPPGGTETGSTKRVTSLYFDSLNVSHSLPPMSPFLHVQCVLCELDVKKKKSPYLMTTYKTRTIRDNKTDILGNMSNWLQSATKKNRSSVLKKRM